ncbi:MAG: glycosyl transferase, partial [Candidatus Magasanikbacteria bacterium CG10_big_fil_rev_8_21_14_0_10_40_10]
GRWANYLFTGILLSDAHNGFRVLKRKALEKINIRQDGMAHNTEIVRQIKKNNFKFVEMGVAVKYHRYGQGIVGGFKILCDLIFDWGE